MRIRVHSFLSASIILAGAALLIAPATAGGPRSVAVVNNSRNAMVSMQIRPSGTTAWQTDVLGAQPLGVKKQISISVSGGPSCYYDVVCRFEDGHRQMKTHVNLCASPKFSVSNF